MRTNNFWQRIYVHIRFQHSWWNCCHTYKTRYQRAWSNLHLTSLNCSQKQFTQHAVCREIRMKSFGRNPKAVFRYLAHYFPTNTGILDMLMEHSFTTTDWEPGQDFANHFSQNMPCQLNSRLSYYFTVGLPTGTTIFVEMVCVKPEAENIHPLGPDRIPTYMLKHWAGALATSHSESLNWSLTPASQLIGIWW